MVLWSHFTSRGLVPDCDEVRRIQPSGQVYSKQRLQCRRGKFQPETRPHITNASLYGTADYISQGPETTNKHSAFPMLANLEYY